MTGRAACVWLVREANNSRSRHRVLKDSWVNSGRSRDGDILQTIQNLLIEQDSDSLKHFLNPEAFGDVQINKAASPAYDPAENTYHYHELQYVQIMNARPGPHDVPNSRGNGAMPIVLQTRVDLSGADMKRPGAHFRNHYRFVLENQGVAIRELNTYQDIYRTIADMAHALAALSKIGYIHRDVSEGNILTVNRIQTGNVGVLGDLEYVKKVAEEETHDVRTGTVMFMATEVLKDSWLFFDPKAKADTFLLVFRPNILHDFESLFWVCFWVATNWVSDLAVVDLPARNNFQALFVNGRREIFGDWRVSREKLRLFTDAVPIIAPLITIQQFLLDLYLSAEEINDAGDFPKYQAVLDGAASQLIPLFEKLKTEMFSDTRTIHHYSEAYQA